MAGSGSLKQVALAPTPKPHRQLTYATTRGSGPVGGGLVVGTLRSGGHSVQLEPPSLPPSLFGTPLSVPPCAEPSLQVPQLPAPSWLSEQPSAAINPANIPIRSAVPIGP